MAANLQEQPPAAAAVDAPPVSFLDWLIRTQVVTPILAERVARVQAETADRLSGILLKLGLLSEPALADELARYCALERLPAGAISAAALEREGLNGEFFRAREIVPLRMADDRVEVACWDPLDDYAVRALSFALGKQVVRAVGTREQIHRALESRYSLTERTGQASSEFSAAVEDEEIERLKDLASEAPVIRLVQRLIDDAVRQQPRTSTSKPSESALHVRFRLDGVLREVERQPKDRGRHPSSRASRSWPASTSPSAACRRTAASA